MAKRRKKSYRRKANLWRTAKGVMYAGAIAAPMYVAYQQLGGGAAGASGAIRAAAFVDPATNKFSFEHGAQIWTPVAALVAVDLVTSKLGLQKRIANGIRNIGF